MSVNNLWSFTNKVIIVAKYSTFDSSHLLNTIEEEIDKIRLPHTTNRFDFFTLIPSVLLSEPGQTFVSLSSPLSNSMTNDWTAFASFDNVIALYIMFVSRHHFAIGILARK